MPKEKEYICSYTFCTHKGDKILPAAGIKEGSRFLHKECHAEKEIKKQIIDIYYKYYKSTEDYKVVTRAVNDLVHKLNIEARYVLFVLCQCIKEKVPFKGIFSLSWQVKNNMVYKKKYSELQARAKVRKFSFVGVECVDTPATLEKKLDEKEKRKTWADTLFGGG